MGLDINGTRFLLHASRQGVDFSRVAMIGRQSLSVGIPDLQRNLQDFGYSSTITELERMFAAEGGYAEPFLRLLGASEVVSFDASDYEKATHARDFNAPLDEQFFGRFSVVLDGGTLEHVFNFPQAISNCMEMVRPGGHFLGITPANNFVGHGFYQFSPELYFRIFSSSNGFNLQQMLAFESKRGSSATWSSARRCTKWYSVSDPETVKDRVTLVNGCETYLLVIAKKVAMVPLFAAPIQQSDYVALWERSRFGDARSPENTATWRSRVPAPLKWPIRAARRWLRAYRERPRSGFDPKHFRKIRIP